MSQTSVRNAVGGVPGLDLAGLTKAEQVAALRSRMAAFDGQASRADTDVYAADDVISAGSVLADVLPAGGLLRRTVLSVADCPALVVAIAAEVTKAGNNIAIVGWPDLVLTELVEHGDISRVVAIPEPGPDSWGVVSVLAEGLDVVMHHGLPAELSPSRARPVWAKIRGGSAAVVSVGARLPGTSTHLDGQVTAYHGIGRGSGRIRGFDIALRCSAKGQPPRSATWTCGVGRRESAKLRVV